MKPFAEFSRHAGPTAMNAFVDQGNELRRLLKTRWQAAMSVIFPFKRKNNTLTANPERCNNDSKI